MSRKKEEINKVSKISKYKVYLLINNNKFYLIFPVYFKSVNDYREKREEKRTEYKRTE